MKKITKFILFLTGQLLFLFTLFIFIPTVSIKSREGISQTNISQITSFEQKHPFLQEIITDKNYLNSVSVLIKNPALINKSKITLEILDSNSNVLRTLNSSGQSIGDPNWLTFKFPFVNSKSGDHFFIRLSTDNQKPDTLFVYSPQNYKTFNYKTSYTYTGFKDSLSSNIQNQINRFKQRQMPYNFIYIFIWFGLNLILFISL